MLITCDTMIHGDINTFLCDLCNVNYIKVDMNMKGKWVTYVKCNHSNINNVRKER